MRSVIFGIKFLRYKLFSKHRKGFGVHSPFLYDFVINVLYSKSFYYAFDDLNQLRAQLLNSDETIRVIDLGAGSKKMNTAERKISEIVRFCAVKRKFGEMIFRLVGKFKPNTILELGTSLGLGTSYIAKANPQAEISTIEGCPKTALRAGENFRLLNLNNIHQKIGNIDEKLPEYLSGIHTLDFVYFDGNHQKESTLKYYTLCKQKAHNDSIFYFDDIHWSKGMEEAWKMIKADTGVSLSIDLFHCGIVFFKKELSKQDFVVKF